MNRACTILICFSLGNLSIAQNLTLPLDLRAEDAEYSRLRYITNMFYLKGNKVANPLDINSAKEDGQATWHEVVLPKGYFPYPMGYGYLFNGAASHPVMGNHTLFLSSNPRYTNFTTIIWVDRNHNFDFTDDGVPDTMERDKSLVISLSDNPKGYQMELVRIFRTKTNGLMLHLNDEKIVKPILGGRVHHGSESSYYTKRLNILGAKYTNGHDSFLVGVKDVNCNGIYGDDGIDEVMIGEYNGVLKNLNSVICGKKGSAYLERSGIAYTIKNIKSNGESITFFRDTAADLKFSLNVGDKIPGFKFCVPEKTKMKKRCIRKYKGKYTYVYIWRAFSPEYLRDSAAFHALGRTGNEDVELVSLNHGGGGNYIKHYSKLYESKMVSGFATNSTLERLKIKNVPTGILLDAKQRIISLGVSPPMVRNSILKYELTLKPN